MELSYKELWTALHGMVFGAGFLLAFTGGLTSLWNLRIEWMTDAGAEKCVRRTIIGAWAMAILAWLTVIGGTYVIYPWYAAKPPQDVAVADLSSYPKYLLLSRPQTGDWHEFGMEWKEHIAWFAPILATTVAFIATRYGKQLLHESRLRHMLLILYSVAFFCAMVAGLFGALINKAAPIR